MLNHKRNIMFYLDIIEHQIDKWDCEERLCNEGAIITEDYCRIKVLIWRIAEELEHMVREKRKRK